MVSVRGGAAAGLTGQAALLSAIPAARRAASAGRAVAALSMAAMDVVVSVGLRRTAASRLGPADVVTLARGTLACVLAGLAVQDALAHRPRSGSARPRRGGTDGPRHAAAHDGVAHHDAAHGFHGRPDSCAVRDETAPEGDARPVVRAVSSPEDDARHDAGVPARGIVPLAVVALVLDAVDGRVARRTNTASAFGARLDGETDAFLILVLSLHVARLHGAWVAAGGVARYAFAAAGWVWPWLRRPLPFRYWRKVATAAEGIALATGAASFVPRPLARAALAVGLAGIAESFGRDIVWLHRRRRWPW